MAGMNLDGIWLEHLQKIGEHIRVFKVTEVRL